MCFPALMIPLAIAGTAISAMGAYQQGQAAKAQAEAQAAFAERQAEAEREKGKFEAARENERANRLLNKQSANFLASGVALEGSPSLIIEDTASETGLDIAAIRYGSELRASNYQYQAQIERMKGQNAATAGTIGAIGAVVGGMTRLASPYSSYGSPYRIA